jgi:Tfp pilus assembly protein PilF
MSYLAFTMAEMNQNLGEAEGLARRAFELAPKDGYVLDTLGWVLYKQKKFTESIKVLEKAYEYLPTASIIAQHLAEAHKAAGLTTAEMRTNSNRGSL